MIWKVSSEALTSISSPPQHPFLSCLEHEAPQNHIQIQDVPENHIQVEHTDHPIQTEDVTQHQIHAEHADHPIQTQDVTDHPIQIQHADHPIKIQDVTENHLQTEHADHPIQIQDVTDNHIQTQHVPENLNQIQKVTENLSITPHDPVDHLSQDLDPSTVSIPMSPVPSTVLSSENESEIDDRLSEFSICKPIEEASIQHVTKLCFRGPFLPLLDLAVDQSRLDLEAVLATPSQ